MINTFYITIIMLTMNGLESFSFLPFQSIKQDDKSEELEALSTFCNSFCHLCRVFLQDATAAPGMVHAEDTSYLLGALQELT